MVLDGRSPAGQGVALSARRHVVSNSQPGERPAEISCGHGFPQRAHRRPHRRTPRTCAPRRRASAPRATWRSESCCRASCHLSESGLIPDCRIIGTSLEDLDDEGFRALATDACAEFGRKVTDPAGLEEFAAKLSYVPQSAGPEALAAAVRHEESELPGEPRRLYHLSVPPNAAADVIKTLGEAGLAERAE